MSEWIKLAQTFGIAVAGLAMLAWFVAKRIWPFIVKQIEDAQSRSKALDEKFILVADQFTAAIRARDVLMAESQRETVKALEAVTKEISGLREEVRSTNKR